MRTRRYQGRRRLRRLLGTLFILAFVIILPAILVRSCTFRIKRASQVPIINLWSSKTNELTTMTIEEYVKGVVAAEMPVSFELEALKAQAVAARTYAYRRIRNDERIPEHPEAHMSTDFGSGQAWVSWDELRDRWGFISFLEYRRKISQAVDDTYGVVAQYNGEPILSVYHSTSGGRTENSENYWSERLPYLRSVDDPYGSHSPHNYDNKRFSLKTFLELMDVEEQGNIAVVERFPSGRVKTFEVGDKWYSGREVRQRLGLKSTWFTVEKEKDTVTFSTWGFGHGVGMAQYGADGMAKRGYDYRQILEYYYQGISLNKMY